MAACVSATFDVQLAPTFGHSFSLVNPQIMKHSKKFCSIYRFLPS